MSRYEEHEVGAGWIDPGNLGNRLRSGIRLLGGGRDAVAGGWVGAVAVTLCLVSWWNDQSVPEILRWIVGCIRQLLA